MRLSFSHRSKVPSFSEIAHNIGNGVNGIKESTDPLEVANDFARDDEPGDFTPEEFREITNVGMYMALVFLVFVLIPTMIIVSN